MNDIIPEPTAADLDELALAIGKAATEIVSNIKTPNEIARLAMFDILVERLNDCQAFISGWVMSPCNRERIESLVNEARALQK